MYYVHQMIGKSFPPFYACNTWFLHSLFTSMSQNSSYLFVLIAQAIETITNISTYSYPNHQHWARFNTSPFHKISLGTPKRSIFFLLHISHQTSSLPLLGTHILFYLVVDSFICIYHPVFPVDEKNYLWATIIVFSYYSVTELHGKLTNST